MIKGFWTNDEPMGYGEAAAMALALKNFGIVASNNLTDIEDLSRLEDIPILTVSILLSFCFELNLMSKEEIELVWKKIINNAQQILPKRTFAEYYDELFEKDCVELLKNYDFKKHYTAIKKEKK